MMQWTSIEAYHEIYDDLPEMRRDTLLSLLRFVNAFGQAPTGQELERYARGHGMSAAGISAGRLKRLSELADFANAIHRSEARRCNVTGHLALTWTPGPEPGTDLGEPQLDKALRGRLRRLRTCDLAVTFEDAQYILGTTESKLRVVWDAESDDTDGTTQMELFT